MTVSLSTPEDIVNDSLARIGWKQRIGSIYDGTEASKIALDIYGQTRDQMLRDSDYGFSEAIAAAVISGAAPAPWSYQYTYPTDAIKIRQLLGPDYLADKNNPLPNNWTIGRAASAQVIWSNLASALLVYTRRVTDPTQWDAAFTEALCAALGRRLAAGLQGMEAVKAEAADEQMETAAAESVTG